MKTTDRERVDPALLAVIGNPGAPRSGPKPPEVPASVPGLRSPVSGLFMLYEMSRRGIAYPAEMRARFGDVYRVPVIGRTLVFVWDADEIQRIFKNEDGAWSAALGWDALMFAKLDPRADNAGSLLSLDFDEHRVARKLVQPAFTLKAIDAYIRVAHRHVEEDVARFLERGEVAFKREVRSLLAKVATEIFTGLRDPREVALVDAALADFWRGMMPLARNPWISPTFRRARAGLMTLIRTFVELAPERRARPGEDVFSRMCAEAPADGRSDEALVRVFVTIMFGAFDTTSAAMASMAYLLAKHPDWQERLRAEAKSIGASTPDASAMKNMKEHEWVWKETLRLMPVTGSLPRRTLREVVVGGHTLAAGTLVSQWSGGMGHHPR
ncbi:MAG TPA: cytochrome P450 [Polyangiaceae bacterium]|jgi:cytochrome P450